MSKRGSKSALFINNNNNTSYSQISIKNGGEINKLHRNFSDRYNAIPVKIRKDKFHRLELNGSVTITAYGKLKVVNVNETTSIIKNLIRLNDQHNFLSPTLKKIVEQEYVSFVREPSITCQVIFTAIMAAICKRP